MDWRAAYRPWSPIEVEPIPVPWARQVGVPVDFVQLPGPVAAPSAEALVEVCQALAYVRVCQARNELDEMERQARRANTARHFAAMAHATFEGPRVHLVCPVCGDAEDVWVDDSGHIEDVRDLVCRQGHEPTVKVEVRDGTTA